MLLRMPKIFSLVICSLTNHL